MTPIELITLDGDGTVWDFETGMRLGLARVAATMTAWGLTIEGRQPSVNDLSLDRSRVADDYRGQELSMERLRWLALERTLRRAQGAYQRKAIDVLYEEFMETRYAGVRPYDDASAVLRTLAKTFRLALITNGNSHPDHVGLSGIFDLVISAQGRGLWKPDPRIYRLATNELGIDPSNAVHVGDHQCEDVQAAANAGFRTVWINRNNLVLEKWCCPDAEISSLVELPPTVRRLVGDGVGDDLCRHVHDEP